MEIPSIESSTRQERIDYVISQWMCNMRCASCGKCAILRGRDPEVLYSDYIEGLRPYQDISKEINKPV